MSASNSNDSWNLDWNATLPSPPFVETLAHLITEPMPLSSSRDDGLFIKDIENLGTSYIQNNPEIQGSLIALSWAFSAPEILKNADQAHFSYGEIRALVRADTPESVEKNLRRFAGYVNRPGTFKIIEFSKNFPSHVSYLFRRRADDETVSVSAVVHKDKDRTTAECGLVKFDTGRIGSGTEANLKRSRFVFRSLTGHQHFVKQRRRKRRRFTFNNIPDDLRGYFVSAEEELQDYYDALLPLLEQHDVLISIPKSVCLEDKKLPLGTQVILVQKGYFDFGLSPKGLAGNADPRRLMGYSLLAPVIMNRALQHFVAAHMESQRETKVLKKYRQMFGLLEQPLSQLSDALGQVQGQTQELRAVLYDPAKALFASYPLIAPLFAEDRPIFVSSRVKVTLNHHGEYDNPLDAKVVLSLAVCRIFGLAGELQSEHTKEGVVSHAREIMDHCQKTDRLSSFEALVKDLCWLFQLKMDDDQDEDAEDDGGGARAESLPAEPARRLPKLSMILDGEPEMVRKYLSALKSVLFEPFKLETETWDTRAIALAVRSRLESENKSYEERVGITVPGIKIDPEHNPCSYHSILSFITDLCAAIGEQHHDKEAGVAVVAGVQVESTAGAEHRIRVAFTRKWAKRDQISRLRDLLSRHVFSATRDWRITETNTGNFRKPFVDLASRLLNVSDDGAGMWRPARPATVATNAWIDIRNERGRAFRIRVEGNARRTGASPETLIIEWVSTTRTRRAPKRTAAYSGRK